MPIITFLTDFGLADYYVPAMKGVVLAGNPAARLIDLSHQISPQNVVSAAYVLQGACRSFPDGAIHVVVVDPGVGSNRRPLIVQALNQYFVGPDNGVFSLIFDLDPTAEIRQITNLNVSDISPTFHGRDVFAQAAAKLSQGAAIAKFGPAITDPVRFADPICQSISPTEWESFIIHIDHFGNCVSGIRRRDLAGGNLQAPFVIEIRRHRIERFKQYYSESPIELGAPFAIWGSADFLEISVVEFSAADLLRVKFGDRIRLTLNARP